MDEGRKERHRQPQDCRVRLTAGGHSEQTTEYLKKKKKKDTLGLIVIPLACEATDTKYN